MLALRRNTDSPEDMKRKATTEIGTHVPAGKRLPAGSQLTSDQSPVAQLSEITEARKGSTDHDGAESCL